MISIKTYDSYYVNNNLTEQLLTGNGFKNGVFKCYVYKNILQLVVNINSDNKKWGYSIIDTDTNTYYSPYYNREYGNNMIVTEVDEKVDKILREMLKVGVFWERRER